MLEVERPRRTACVSKDCILRVGLNQLEFEIGYSLDDAKRARLASSTGWLPVLLVQSELHKI